MTPPPCFLPSTTDLSTPNSAFPPRSSLPTGCLHHLRVWLRTPAGIDHRIFGEQDLWFGRDPDFTTIANASFASLRHTTQDMSIYQGIVGRAYVNFTIRSRSPPLPLSQDLIPFPADGNPSKPEYTHSPSITKLAAWAKRSLRTTISDSIANPTPSRFSSSKFLFSYT